MTQDSIRQMQSQVERAKQDLAAADDLIALLEEAGEDVADQRRQRAEVHQRVQRWEAALVNRSRRSA